MRTIKVELVMPVPDQAGGISAIFGGGAAIHVSTEAVVDDDNAREAGTEACNVLTAFIEGYGEVQA